MKKLLALLLALFLVISLIACGSKKNSSADKNAAQQTGDSGMEEEGQEDPNPISRYAKNYGDSFLATVEDLFTTGSGMTCTSSVKAENDGLVIHINLNEMDNVDKETKASLQSSYEDTPDTWDALLEQLQFEEPAIKSFQIYVCDVDGDVLATICRGA